LIVLEVNTGSFPKSAKARPDPGGVCCYSLALMRTDIAIELATLTMNLGVLRAQVMGHGL
jgi:hypothetical protein